VTTDNDTTAAAERVRRVRDLEPVEVVYGDDFEGAEWAYSNDLSALAVEYVNQQPTYTDLAKQLAEAKAQAAAIDDATPLTPEMVMKRNISWYFWKFIHNAIVHPLLSLPYEPLWVQRLHDWTAKRCWGGG